MIQTFRLARRGLRGAILITGVVALLQAAPISGQLLVSGAAETTQTTIDFSPYIPGAPYNGTGTLLVSLGTNFFAPISFGDQLQIVDRSVIAGVVPAQPAGLPISVPNWITFPNNPGFRYALDLTFINAGTYSSAACGLPPADGQVCTPPAPVPLTSPYNLTNFRDGQVISSNATFSLRGEVRNIDTNLVAGVFTAVFGAEFQTLSFQEVLLAVGTLPDGAVLSGFSGSIIVSDTAIPEPSTAILVAIGTSLLASGLLRRRRSKS